MNPVVWFEIYVEDMARARAFYEKTLGVKLTQMGDPTEEMDMWAFPATGPEGAGAAGALAYMRGAPRGGGTLVYFRSDDCAIESGRAAEAGGSIMREKMSIGPYGYIALVNDTEGNMFGVHSMA
jgi:uncharacterized protein